MLVIKKTSEICSSIPNRLTVMYVVCYTITERVLTELLEYPYQEMLHLSFCLKTAMRFHFS